MTFSFIQITDHHLPESEAELIQGFSPARAFRAVMHHISEHTASLADFIVSTGDLVETPSETAYRNLIGMLNLGQDARAAPGPLRVSLEGLRDFPVYCLPGNHDDRDQFFLLFPRTSPTPLLNAALIHKGVQFIFLDWGKESKAHLHQATLDFLTRSLRADAASILFMHHHFVPVGSRWLDDFIADDAGKFWDILRGQKVLGIFCGHTHIPYERIVENIPVFGVRSTTYSFVQQDEPLACLLPPQYRLVTIQDGILTSRVYEVPL